MVQFAAALLFGGAYLFGTFLCTWATLFQKKKYTPVAARSKVKYDETPLRMKVSEANDFFSSGASCLKTSTLPGQEFVEYVHAKIQRIESSFSHSG